LLTSVKPPAELEKYTPETKPSRTKESTLMSGRQAGAGWHKSKYVGTNYMHLFSS
jgi:hypothetical protein